MKAILVVCRLNKMFNQIANSYQPSAISLTAPYPLLPAPCSLLFAPCPVQIFLQNLSPLCSSTSLLSATWLRKPRG